MNKIISFVVGVRVLWFSITWLISKPVGYTISWLFSSDDFEFSTIDRVVDNINYWVNNSIIPLLPGYIEHHGNGVFLLESNRGMDVFDRVSDSIPPSIFNHWKFFSVCLMKSFLVLWGIILLVLIGAGIWKTGELLKSMIEWIFDFNWLLSLELMSKTTIPEYTILDVFSLGVDVVYGFTITTIILVIGFIFISVLTWVVIIPLLPGLVFHEFGHYVTMKKSGKSVERYGLLFMGPILAGAFVDPENEDFEDVNIVDSFGICSAGVGNSFIWGILLVGVGVMIGGNPVGIITSLFNHDFSIFFEQPLISLFISVGMVELSNSFLNGFPFGPIDGGLYMKNFESEYWEIESPIDIIYKHEVLLNNE